MRRRNRPKVVWLPNDNTDSIAPSNTSTWAARVFNHDLSTIGAVSVTELGIVQDGKNDQPLQSGNSLADIESVGYRLRRIVGKLYIFIAHSTSPGGQAVCGVTAGFIIRRTDQLTSNSLAIENAVAAQTLTDPANIGNIMDPWIWRRSWLLGQNNANTPTVFGDVPDQNFGAQYPGALEGPHIDQKTARIIGPEERLFLDISVTTLLNGGDAVSPIVVFTDLRVLASMRANVGNRRNASR